MRRIGEVPYHGDEHGRFVRGGGRRGRRKPVMAEINVTPMVDVMLVLLIIFMVSAPLLTVGVPLDLPQTQAKSLEQDKTPLQLSVDIQRQGVHQRYRSGDERADTEIKGHHRRPRRHGRAYISCGRTRRPITEPWRG